MRWKTLVRLAAVDGRRILRDDFLAWITAVPVAVALALRALGDPFRDAVGAPDRPECWLSIVETAFFAVVVPLLVGTLLGFMLLDEKDNRTLTAIRVTPVSLTGYLMWRALAAWLLSMLAVILTLPLSGLTSLNAAGTILTAAAGAPLAASFGLILATVAGNKIQGFAVVKLVLVALLLPCVSLILGGFWEWATVWLPSWWPVMAHHAAVEGAPAWGYLAGSYLVNTLLAIGAAHRLSTQG